MKLKTGLLLVMLTILLGCGSKYGVPEEMEAQRQEYRQLSKSKNISVLDEPYLGARVIERKDLALSPILKTRVEFKGTGSLQEICASLSELVPVSIEVAASESETSQQKPSRNVSGEDPLDEQLMALLNSAGSDEPVLKVPFYQGALSGLLDQLSTMSGYGWDFNAAKNSIVFGHMQVRTFTILSAPGKVMYENQLTNKSKETTSSSIGGTGVSQTVATADTSIQTAQTNKTTLDFDVYEESMQGVRALLSAKGSVTGNQGAGTITVRDTPARLRQIATYIDEINSRLNRQVALTVYVWSLELSDDSEAGFDLQALFRSADIALATGGVGELTSSGSVTATILNGKLTDSKAILKALRKWGNTSVVTSGGGIAMSNQPLPVLAIKRHAYLAGVSSTTTDYGQTAEVTPGEVTSGFAMTVVPHILDRRRVILQYNINLSSLDDLVEFSTQDVQVQLPQVSTRSFSQRTSMKMGQTLVLAGFEQETRSKSKSLGIFGTDFLGNATKTLLVITIEVESAGI